MNALPTHIRENAIVFYELPSRDLYVKKFIQRLELVPQILPVHKGYVGRTRLDHSRNICRIVDSIAFLGVPPQLKVDLMKGALCHDIGHPQYGHPAERAINAFFGLENKFLNDLHSLRILYFRPGEESESLPLFRTEPATRLHSLFPRAGEMSCVAATVEDEPALSYRPELARMLDFMDDLENAVGDIGDLIRNFPNTRVPRAVRDLGLAVPVNVADTWVACYRVLQRAVPTLTFENVSKMLEGDSDFPLLIKELRRGINEARTDNQDILEADQAFFEKTTNLVGRVSDAVFSSIGVSTATIEAVIDIAASTVF